MKNLYPDFFIPGSEEEQLLSQLNKKKIPKHIAFIMDGNGRWAKGKKLSRSDGHKAGVKTANLVSKCSRYLGVKHITLYAFSSENWKRPVSEINTLMDLLHDNILNNNKMLFENDIKFNVIGNISKLPIKLKSAIEDLIEKSKNHKSMEIILALNYGSRSEIVRAVKRIIQDGVSEKNINEKTIKKYLYTAGIEDPQLIIRTSGEQRLSNFLLYQAAYSEFYFSDIHWPDFCVKEYLKSILDYQNRDRRFGGI